MSQIVKDGGLVAVDCVVISCCCPCLVLQITIFLFIRLPHKLAIKCKRIILRKLHKRSKRRKRDLHYGSNEFEEGTSQPELMEFPPISERGGVVFVGRNENGIDDGAWITRDMNFVVGDGSTWCEDEKNIWRELIEKEGLFWFGNFWANGDFT